MKNKTKLLITISCIVLVGLFFTSMTYAKYISSVDISDEARVAVWDINATTDVDLFKSSYYLDEEAKEGEYVKSFTGANVVAPGTEGQYEFTISGKPETNYRLSVNIDAHDSIGRNPENKGSEGRMIYYFGIKGGTLFEYTNIDDLKYDIELALNDKKKVYAAGTSTNTVFTIKWKWVFEEFDDKGNLKTEIDEKDTSIGNAAVLEKNGGVDEGEEYENQPRVRLTVKVLAEQTTDAATAS